MYKKIMIGIFACIFVCLPVMSLIFMPKDKKAFSENENRYLQEFPTISWNNIKDETFMNQFDLWFSDHFLLREKSIECKNQLDLWMGKQEINGVFIQENQMMEKWDESDEALLKTSILAMNTFASQHKEANAYFILAPTSQEIYKEKLPKYAVVDDQMAYIDEAYNLLEGIEGIDVCNELRNHKEEYVYYRTDHHWTTYGAYLAYQKAAETIGWKKHVIDDYEIEDASNEFLGTLYSKTLNHSVTMDTLSIYTEKEAFNDTITMTIHEGVKETVKDSIYDRSYLDVKDKYSVFLGLNQPMLTIENESGTTNKSALIIKDSYANCMIPFLLTEYDSITVVDLRYYNDVNALNENQYDDIIFIYNVITFSEEKNLVKLGITANASQNGDTDE